MRPPFAYYGGKTALAARIVDLMPAHRVYIEAFFGSGAVLFGKGEVGCEIVNDRDGGLVAFFGVLRDRPEDLERVCRLTPYARVEYAAADLDAPGVDEPGGRHSGQSQAQPTSTTPQPPLSPYQRSTAPCPPPTDPARSTPPSVHDPHRTPHPLQ